MSNDKSTFKFSFGKIRKKWTNFSLQTRMFTLIIRIGPVGLPQTIEYCNEIGKTIDYLHFDTIYSYFKGVIGYDQSEELLLAQI